MTTENEKLRERCLKMALDSGLYRPEKILDAACEFFYFIVGADDDPDDDDDTDDDGGPSGLDAAMKGLRKMTEIQAPFMVR